jgi:hypothetical protein
MSRPPSYTSTIRIIRVMDNIYAELVPGGETLYWETYKGEDGEDHKRPANEGDTLQASMLLSKFTSAVSHAKMNRKERRAAVRAAAKHKKKP